MPYSFSSRRTLWRAGGTWHASSEEVQPIVSGEWLAAVDPIPAGDATSGHGGRLVLRRGYRSVVSDAIAAELRGAGYGDGLTMQQPPPASTVKVHNAPIVWASAGQAEAFAALEARVARLEAAKARPERPAPLARLERLRAELSG